MFFFVIAGLLVCTEAQGSSALTPLFVQTGKDLRLDVMTPVSLVKHTELRWKYNKDENIVRLLHDNTTIIIDCYVGRADISAQNYSLLLKNVQQADSGHYSAHFIGNNEKYVAEYNVTVQGSCNITVTCSTQDSHHINSTFTCDTQTCSQDRGETSKTTTSAASLQVYLWNGSIICNHSNQVSWAKDVNTPKSVCPQQLTENVSGGISVCLVKTVMFSVGLIIMVSVVIGVHLMERKTT
ncbi:uncharacterized protein LOC121192763 isoform X2 [Toxotes jaculatrix]|uniref:uncharacterized protein LOC121192763 isoform X2 n=1 Tax=Toxotes jaculatrix TaxID=941984 RepID=UPI001B3A7E9D|nr:uncharacterized protein LOC121192763 isoform X2 [Toxotes jaculatrix]